MNMTVEPTDLQAVVQERVATPSPSHGPNRLTLALGATLILAALVIVGMATLIISDDSEPSTPVAATESVAARSDNARSVEAGSDDAGTGNATVDEQIVDTIWETQGKTAICPAFNDVRETMPGLSDEEIFDMGVALADDMDSMTPAQLDRMRELVLTDC